MKKTSTLIPIAVAILSLHLAPFATALPPQPLDIWTWRNPLPTGNQLNGVTHGVNSYGTFLWVAVGATNTILTSPDGGNWEQQITAPGTPNSTLSGVAYDPSSKMFVAVGADAATATTNTILTSTDGTNWISAGYVGTNGLFAVAADGSGHFMAVGNKGVNLYSSGGQTWTQNPAIAGGVAGGDFYGVAYGLVEGNPGFVTVGDGGTLNNIYTTENNGNTWTYRASSPLTSYSLYGVNYDSGNGEFVAVGYQDIINSPDGVNWFDTPGDSASAVVFGKNEFVTVSDNDYEIYSSPGDAQSGPDIWQGTNAFQLFDGVDYDGGVFVAVGPGGTIATNLANVMTPTNWVSVSTNVTTTPLNAIAYGQTASGQNLFVAGGGGYFGEAGVVTSTNGYDWQLDTDSTLLQFYDSFITGMAYGNNLVNIFSNSVPGFVATVNTIGGFSGYSGEIIYSFDGVSWSTNYGANFVLNGIVCGQNASSQPLFVAVGNDGFIVSSSDPTVSTSWGRSSYPLQPSASLKAVAYGNPGTPTFVAVGSSGPAPILVSTDGNANEWISAPFPSTADSATFYGVTYGDAQFVAVGTVGTILTSPNGQTWTQQTSGTTASLTGVTFADGLFVAVSGGSGSAGTILVSPDGANWTEASTVTPGSLNAVVAGNYQYVAVGSGGAIVGSLLASVGGGTVSSGSFTFSVSGPPGEMFGVYVSHDLITWTWLQNISFSAETPSQTISDSLGNYSGGFYDLGPPGP